MYLEKICITNLCKSFWTSKIEKLSVLDNLSLKIKKREFAVLLGPSGCGKTTLLRIIAGLEKADYGSILIDNANYIESLDTIGMVFQSYTSFPWLTVRENIQFGLRVRGIPEDIQLVIAEKYLQLVDLKEFENSYPMQLSGGMKQRVALARTLAIDPEIILLDEPFGALDSQTRATMQEFLLDIWERDHKTILFVTHDIDEAIFLADTIFISSKRPAKIIQQIDIDLHRPREYNIRTSNKFNIIKRNIDQIIRDELTKHNA